MRKRESMLIAACGSAVFAAPALAGGQTDQDLQARIAEMEQRMQQLEAQNQRLEAQANGEAWLTEARAAEIRSIVQDVIADADTRASLLQGGGSAGHDGHFFLGSADGNFHLELAGQVQVRWVFNHQEDDDAAGIDSTRHGFEIRRNKINFSGHVFDPTWQFDVTGAFERDGGAFVLEDAIITKELGDNFVLNIGQFKPHFMWEENTSSKRQLAVDRSLVNEEYNQDRAQGVELGYEGEMFRIYAMYSDGFNSDNTAALAYDTEWGAITARADVLFAGSWSQMRDFTSWRGEDFGARVGAAVHYEVQEYGTTAGPEEDLFTWTIDGQLEFGGANIFAAFVGRHLEEADLDQFGFVVQGGIFLTDNDEIFGRFEWSDFDVDSVEDLFVVTVGWNHYFHKHNLKWTTDIGVGFDEVSSPFASSGAGWRADAPGEDTQIVFRTQLQLLW